MKIAAETISFDWVWPGVLNHPKICLDLVGVVLFLCLSRCFFLNFGVLLETRVKLLVTEPDFLGKKICPQDWESGPKMDQKQGFLNFFKIWSVIFTEFDL